MYSNLEIYSMMFRAIVAFDRPTAAPKVRVLHGVISAGGASNVRVITATTRSSLTVRGAPGRGSSLNPSRRRSRNRSRHLQTQSLDAPSRAATARFVRPSAPPNTIRERSARRCAGFGRRVHSSKVRRSAFGVRQHQRFVVACSLHGRQRTNTIAKVQGFF